jgi:hypothetical protein
VHFGNEGKDQTQTVTVTDVAGNTASFTSKAVSIDMTPPETTASLAGTQGSNGWYTSAVTVTLSATDNLSGVARTHYTVYRAGHTPPDHGRLYTAPFKVSRNGIHIVTFWSVDKARNRETPNSLQVAVDTGSPCVTAAASPTVLSPANGQTVPVTVSGAVTGTVSGVDLSSAKFSVADDYGTCQPGGSITVNPDGTYAFTVPLQAEVKAKAKAARRYTITVTAKNNAGNEGSACATVSVPGDQP